MVFNVLPVKDSINWHWERKLQREKEELQLFERRGLELVHIPSCSHIPPTFPVLAPCWNAPVEAAAFIQLQAAQEKIKTAVNVSAWERY